MFKEFLLFLFSVGYKPLYKVCMLIGITPTIVAHIMQNNKFCSSAKGIYCVYHIGGVAKVYHSIGVTVESADWHIL